MPGTPSLAESIPAKTPPNEWPAIMNSSSAASDISLNSLAILSIGSNYYFAKKRYQDLNSLLKFSKLGLVGY